MYIGYGIVFDGKGYWGFNIHTDRNVIIFVNDNSSSLHTDNLKNDFLILGEGDTFGINGSFVAPEKKLILVLIKQRQNFSWVCIVMVKIFIDL